MPGGLLFAVVVLVVAAAGIYSFIANRRRREDLQRIAVIKQLRFYPYDPFDIPSSYGDMHLCSPGHSKRASNVIDGDLGSGHVRYFDYRYTVGSGKNSHTYSKSGCAFHVPYHFSRLLIRPENVLDKAAGLIGFEDIDLDNAEFNRKFYVAADDKKFAYDVLNQRLMEFLLTRSGITIELAANRILFSYGSRLSAAEVAKLIDVAASFPDFLPNFLKSDRSLRPPEDVFASPAERPGASETHLTFGGIEPSPRKRNAGG